MAITTPVEDVFRRALALSHEERQQLLDLLTGAFDGDTEGDDEWDDAYIAELDEVEAAIKNGTMKTYSQEDVREFVRQKLARVD